MYEFVKGVVQSAFSIFSVLLPYLACEKLMVGGVGAASGPNSEQVRFTQRRERKVGCWWDIGV